MSEEGGERMVGRSLPRRHIVWAAEHRSPTKDGLETRKLLKNSSLGDNFRGMGFRGNNLGFCGRHQDSAGNIRDFAGGGRDFSGTVQDFAGGIQPWRERPGILRAEFRISRERAGTLREHFRILRERSGTSREPVNYSLTGSLKLVRVFCSACCSASASRKASVDSAP